jgi:hypothetical protein
MSLRSFQQALVDLTLSPTTATALRNGDLAALAPYELTQLERERLVDVVRQPGVSVHCSLSRGNRLEMIVGAFPMTCVLLRPVLRGLLDELWRLHRPTNYQLSDEVAAFAALIARKLAAGELALDYVAEIFVYEQSCLELTQRARLDPDAELWKIVEFQHHPDALLGPLSRQKAPPSGLASGQFRARVVLLDGRFDVELLAS